MARGPDKQFDPEQALERAMQLFWTRGYAATGMSELLEVMGIARKSLYDTFGNKRSLFIQALQRYGNTELAAVEADLARSGSPLGNVRRVLRSWQKVHSEPGSRGCMLGNNTAHFGDDDPEMARILAGYFKGLERAFATALQAAQDQGEISARASVQDQARLLVATAQGLALICRTRGDGAVARSVVRAALSQLEAT